MIYRAGLHARVAAIAVLCLSSTLAWAQGGLLSRTYRHETSTIVSMDLEPGSALRVRRDEADIEIRFLRAAQGELLAHARVRCASEEGLQDIAARFETLPDGTLELVIDGPGDEGPGWVVDRIDITAPLVARLEAQTDDGELTVIGLRMVEPKDPGRPPLPPRPAPDGSILFGTWFSQLPFSSLTADRGSIRVEGSEGPLRVRTDGGRVTLTDHAGPLDIATASGWVDAEGLNAPFSVWTRGGKVELSIERGFEGPVRVHTSSGRVEVDPGVPTTARDAGLVPSSVTTASGSIEIVVDDPSRDGRDE